MKLSNTKNGLIFGFTFAIALICNFLFRSSFRILMDELYMSTFQSIQNGKAIFIGLRILFLIIEFIIFMLIIRKLSKNTKMENQFIINIPYIAILILFFIQLLSIGILF